MLIDIYRFLFARKCFYKLNKLIYLFGLSGLGILNHKSNQASGETTFLKSYFLKHPGGVVVDVGANIGNYSSAVLDLNPSATVYAFEPHPKTFIKLSENLNGDHFYPINAAVGDAAGEVSLYDYEDRDGSSHASLYKGVIENIHKSRPIEHKVRVIKLGDFLQEKGVKNISLLKIDTEGNELNVLKGVMEYINSGTIAAIHFEFNEMNVVSRTYFKDFFELLTNYEFYRLLPDGMVGLGNYNPLLCEIFAYQNIVAILKTK